MVRCPDGTTLVGCGFLQIVHAAASGQLSSRSEPSSAASDFARSASPEWLSTLPPEVLDRLPSGMCVCDAEGKILRCNRRASELWGQSFPPGSADPLYAAYSSGAVDRENPVKEALRTGELIRGREASIERPDGNVVVLLVNVDPLRDANGSVAGAVSCFEDITSQRDIEDELRTSRQDLEDFFENGAIGLHWVASDGTILRVNQTELDLLGYAREEYVGRHIADFHVDEPVINDILARLTRGERLDKFDARLRAKDGSIKHVLISSNVQFRDGRFVNTRCFTLDVTDLKQSQDALRDSEQRLRATHDRAFAGIAEVDLDGSFLRVNARFSQLTGYSEDELLKRRFEQITHPDDAEADADQFRTLVAGEKDAYTGEKRFVRKDGATVWVELSASIVRNARGTPLFGIRVVQDISELKRAEERQKHLLDELNHRVKNTLATVQSVAAQTRRSAADPAAFTRKFEGRLMALNRAHELLARDIGQGADLGDLVRATLEPYRSDDANRITVEGPPVRLGSEVSVTLAMALHELATNAAEHGALSLQGGRVEVNWRIDMASSEQARHLRFQWVEEGGPPVPAEPARRAFGAQLLERGLARQLGGEATIMFDRAGIRYVFSAPLPQSVHPLA